MKLVYTKDGSEVKVGDTVVLKDGVKAIVIYFRKPFSPASSGKVTVRQKGSTYDNEFYVGVIGAKWIDREDHVPIEEDTIHGYFHEVNK